MKHLIIISIILMAIAPFTAQTHCGSCSTGKSATVTEKAETTQVVLSNPKKAQWISKDYYVEYDWNKTPKIGTSILSVKVFDKSKKPVTDLAITADVNNTSQKDTKATGDIALKPNKKGEFIVPVNFVSQGNWEIQLRFAKGDKALSNASIRVEIK